MPKLQVIDGKDFVDGVRRGSDKDKARKRAKVVKFVNRVRACRSFDGLERVADEVRAEGLWHAEDGWISEEVGKCNGRLRGRPEPAVYIKGNVKVTVSYNKVVAREPATLQIYTPKQASKMGFLYSPVKDKS